ncbi:MAG: substrate-binding domain-containing protein [Pseudomonadota bacterium]
MGAAHGAGADTSDLVSDTAFRVCADPANMPFSNKAGEGFENKLAELLAAKLERPVQYTWFPQAIGFVRQTLRANRCDVIMGYAQGHELVLNTNHYYVSAYALVTRTDGELGGVDQLSDPLLQGKRLGVVAGSPPATHMARYGLIGLARPYPLMVDSRHDNTPAKMIKDLVEGEVEGAVIWGPIGGYLAQQAGVDLSVTPLLKETGAPRMFYRVTLGVRQGEIVWKRQLNSLLRRNKAEIDAILTEFGVPIVDTFGKAASE